MKNIPNNNTTSRANIIPSTSIAPARERIIARAQRLFFTTGFKSVTMTDLAAELGMSKKTLYQHFDSKDALLISVLNSKFDQVGADLARVMSQKDKPAPQLLPEMLTCLQKHVSQIHPAFVRDVERSDRRIFALIDERRQALIREYFGALLSRGRREGVFRKDIPVEVLVEILLSSARAIVNPERLVKYSLSPQKAFAQVLGVFLYGILTEKAR